MGRPEDNVNLSHLHWKRPASRSWGRYCNKHQDYQFLEREAPLSKGLAVIRGVDGSYIPPSCFAQIKFSGLHYDSP